jgi:hypothetical protein
MLYRLVGDAFFASDSRFDPTDISIPETELKDAEELAVPMPAENATLNSLAIQISSSLPNENELRSDPAAARQRLRDLIRLDHYESHPQSVNRNDVDGIKIIRWRVRLGDEWTVPAVELVPPAAQGRTIILGDRGRCETGATVRRHLEAGERILAVDLLGFGEAGEGIAPSELQMIATVGGRLLGVQAAQLLALADWLDDDAPRPMLVALGPRSGVIALVAAAVEPQAFQKIDLHDSWPSLKEFIHQKLELEDAPELSCFGLLKEFDIPQLEALIAPGTVIRGADE